MPANQAQKQEVFKKMAQICSRSEQCSFDIRRKMDIYDLVDEIVDEIIAKLKKEKFIDDERFVRAYVADKFRINKWGKIKIRHYLKMKGLPDDIVELGLSSIDQENYIATLVKTMKDKARTVKKKNRFEKLGQIIRFAQSRGFEPELIHRYMDKVV
ncbi:MAG: RecX family transcriptional regulator [Draconibacterium sp.]|nr:MAG: RecX family transcriptional regulator [Draconibacterium sp.]